MYTDQHEVTTKWGHFLLDDAAYAAYLDGKLWITWGANNDNRNTDEKTEKPSILSAVTHEAIRFREACAHQNVYTFLQIHFPGAQVSVPYSNRMKNVPIEEMNLSVRSSNALMRANANTFERVMEIMQIENGFKMIRNVGIKSEKEIVRNFFCACYKKLTPIEQAMFWQRVIDRERKNNNVNA